MPTNKLRPCVLRDFLNNDHPITCSCFVPLKYRCEPTFVCPVFELDCRHIGLANKKNNIKSFIRGGEMTSEGRL